MSELGILYGISVGTGDPELITLKGLRLLREAGAIAFPAGVNGKPGMAEQIVRPWLAYQQPTLALEFPYIHDSALLSQAWHKAADRVWHYLKNGQDVAFACEGDISFYSTFTYLAQTLHQEHPEVPIEIIPGVSSPCAAAATLGLPLTLQGQRMAILPALYGMEELELALNWADVVVLLKVSSNYQELLNILERHKLLKQSWIVERATLPEQKIYPLRDRPALKLNYFSIAIVQVHLAPIPLAHVSQSL